MKLRAYQNDAINEVFKAWESFNNVLLVQPTGTGKTVIFCDIINKLNNSGYKIAVIAHRKELLGQISITLNKYCVKHNILAPKETIRSICKLHYKLMDNCCYDNYSRVTVMSAHTVKSRGVDLSQFDYWIIDEGHHVLKNNLWGEAVAKFTNAKGLGVTATPCRTDNKGLGSHASGVYDILIDSGKDMRWYIENGYLSEYKIYFPGNHIDMTGAKRGKDGDWTIKEIITRTEKAKIVGDIVEQYLIVAKGKRGITFMPSVKLCEEVADSFKLRGVPAAVLTGSTPDLERFETIRAFERGEILQLVNVDLFSEGFDLPAVESVSMGRKTASLQWYRQVVGRVLRPCEGKKYGIINDHVGNVLPEHGGHGLPDQPVAWTLDDLIKKSSSSAPSITKVCAECTAVYRKTERQCPYCGHVPKIVERITPDLVDGDLTELDEETLQRLRKNVIIHEKTPEEIKNTMLFAGASHIAANSAAKWKRLELTSREELKRIIKNFNILMLKHGFEISEIYKQFYSLTGTDQLTVLTMNRRKMDETIQLLTDEIRIRSSKRNQAESK